MAGMLAGVECARRRRFHKSNSSDSSLLHISNNHHTLSRRPSYCLYTSTGNSISSSSIATLHGNTNVLHNPSMNQECLDCNLGGVARRAKDRLDQRLRSLPKSTRCKNKEHCNDRETQGELLGDLQTEVFGLKNKVCSKRFSWAKLKWRASDQDECAVCLEFYKDGETLVHLPCAHRFHSKCLVPWLENNAHCPVAEWASGLFNFFIVFY